MFTEFLKFLFTIFIYLSIGLAKAFGKNVGFMIGMILLPFIFYSILGLGKSEYIGPKRVFDRLCNIFKGALLLY